MKDKCARLSKKKKTYIFTRTFKRITTIRQRIATRDTGAVGGADQKASVPRDREEMTPRDASVLFVLLWRALAAADRGGDGVMTVFRLPADTSPVSYSLKVAPDYGRVSADSVAFDGEVEIVFVANARTSNVTLNCKGLSMYVAYVHEKDTQYAMDVCDVVGDDANEQLVVVLTSPLRVNVQYVLNVEYKGNVENAMNGLYNSTYGDYGR